MTVAAIMTVRDEADIVGYTLAHLLAEGVDRIYVADNLSTDDTRAILDCFAAVHDVQIIDDPDPGYWQADKMTRLAHTAMLDGWDWVLPCDADEAFYWPGGTLAEFFAACELDVVAATGWDHLVTDGDDPDIANPMLRIQWRRPNPQKLPKVAFRASGGVYVEIGNHEVRHPGRHRGTGLHYRHWQYRSYPQMVHKVRVGKAAYDATDLAPTYGTHWREAGALGDDELADRWRRLCTEGGLVHDPAPVRSL